MGVVGQDVWELLTKQRELTGNQVQSCSAAGRPGCSLLYYFARTCNNESNAHKVRGAISRKNILVHAGPTRS